MAEPIRVIHAADCHLGAPLEGLDGDDRPWLEHLRGATRQAFTALVDTAIADAVHLVLLAGDVFDQAIDDGAIGLYLVRQVQRLTSAGIAVAIVWGNHDFLNAITSHMRLPESPLVKVFRSSAPETWVLDDWGLAIHGQSYPSRNVSANLAANYPAPKPGLVNIGLLHTNLDGRPGHEDYAPATRVDLANAGYDYWALGHVHAADVMRFDAGQHNGWIVYPGCLQGRHCRETGRKGAMRVTISDGRVQQPEPLPLAVVGWHHERLSGAAIADADAFEHAVLAAATEALADAQVPRLAMRVVIDGPSPAHAALQARQATLCVDLRARLIDHTDNLVWLDSLRLRTQPLSTVPWPDELAQQLTTSLAALRDQASDDPLWQQVRAECDLLWRRLPKEAQPTVDADASGAGNLDAVIADVLDEVAGDLQRLVDGSETTAP